MKRYSEEKEISIILIRISGGLLPFKIKKNLII